MEFEHLISKIKKIVAYMYNKENFYGSKSYGGATYCSGGIELTICRERSYKEDSCTYTIYASDFLAEYVVGTKDMNEGKHGNFNFKKFEDVQFVGDKDALNRALFLLELCRTDYD